MLVTFKLLQAKQHNQWLGWFGDDLIKVRLTEQNENCLIQFLQSNLGISKDKITVIKAENGFITVELPDIAWELLLSAIE